MTICFVSVLLILIASMVWFDVTSVGCSNISEEWKKESELQKTKLTDRGRDKNLIKLDSTRKNTSTADKKVGVTESKVKTNKSNLRMGRGNTTEPWPKVQKRRLREKENQKPQKRFTKMNMMQMDDATDTPYQFVMQGAELNESLNPYNIKHQMTRIMAKYPNANATVEVIGRTLEYNDIVLIKITHVENKKKDSRLRTDETKYENDSDDKKVIFIVHGLAVMGMFYLDCLTEEAPFGLLLSYYLKHLDKFDIFLMPMANPDGYAYKLDEWNKNVSPQNACPGVALDRNFDVAWNTTPTISSCSQQYPGPGPFSEPESRAVRDVLHRYTHKIIAYIHVHGGMYSSTIIKGDAVLYPKGYTDAQTDDDKYIDMKGEIDEAMRRANFQVYAVAVDTLYNWYGRVSGTSVDYASTVYGIPYAMEFVMQIFREGNKFYSMKFEDTYAHHALVEVWRRVIDVVFNNIWSSLHSNEE